MQERKVILVGQRVGLGELLEEDQKQLWEWRQNLELLHLIVDHHAPTIEEQHGWFTKAQDPDREMFSLMLVPSHTLIGHGGFVDIDGEMHSAQFRITIGDPMYWGRGYGTEATQLILRHGFESLRFRRVWLRVLLSNERAIRSYRKVGFREVGREQVGDNGTKECMRMDIHAHEVQ